VLLISTYSPEQFTWRVPKAAGILSAPIRKDNSNDDLIFVLCKCAPIIIARPLNRSMTLDIREDAECIDARDVASHLYELVADRIAHERRRRGDIELAHDGRAVCLNSLGTYVEDGCDR
jgi:hypothetical protein